MRKAIFGMVAVLFPLISANSTSQFEQFREAILRGETSRVKTLLKSGVDPDVQKETPMRHAIPKHEKGTTPLMVAASTRASHAKQAAEEIAELLLKHGGNVNARSTSGRTALMVTDNLEKAKILIEHGANVNARKQGGNMALHQASLSGDYEMVELLLERGAEVNAKINDDWTALIKASAGGNTDIIRLLLKKGANIHAKQNEGYTAFLWSARDGEKKAAELLLNIVWITSASTGNEIPGRRTSREEPT